MDKKSKSNLYFKFTLIFFGFLLLSLFLTSLIIFIIWISPFKNILINRLLPPTILLILSIYLASTIISSIIMYLFSKKFLAPVVELSNKSLLVSKGNFEVQVTKSSSIPEIKQTIDNFNKMVIELKKIEILSKNFVSNVSHEFKTPLSVIRSYVNILENKDLSDEERKEYLTKINESISKLSTLITNVLNISKLDNEKISINKKNYRLDEQIRQCILDFSDLFDQKNIELEINLDDSVIYADEEMMIHVWNNLLSNAIKYTSSNGKVIITLIQEEELTFSIQDNGIGMDEETISNIFERFYQGETSHSKEGNGLGLSIVKKIVELHEGSIKVESELNKGSTFIVRLPIAVID